MGEIKRCQARSAFCDSRYAARRIEALEAERDRLQALVKAQRALIDWYATEHGRSSTYEPDLPEDFRELEAALRKAEEAVD